jgi:hypothetical protein
MPQISNSNLRTVLDKLARFCAESTGDLEFNPAFTAGVATASANVLSGYGAIAAFLLTLADEDIESDMLPPFRDLDQSNPPVPDGFVLTPMRAALAGLDAHFKHFGFVGLDAYLKSINGAAGITPTLRVHGHFRKYLKNLSALNCFIPNDLVLATFLETGGAAGTYAHLAAIDTPKYAGAKLVAKNVTALTTSAVITVTAKKVDGTSASLTATLSTHTINHETDLYDTTAIYTDVTAISMASGGTNLDEFEIVAKTDRSVASA